MGVFFLSIFLHLSKKGGGFCVSRNAMYSVWLEGGCSSMTLLIDRPNTLVSEWVLGSSLAPAALFAKLRDADFREEKKGVFYQSVEGTQYTIQRQSSKELYRFNLYYARYNGNPEMGQILNDFVCQQIGLDVRAFEIFIPYQRKDRLKMIRDIGFNQSGSATSGLANHYSLGEISLIVVEEGLLLQIRGKHEKDWNRLYRLVFHVLAEMKEFMNASKRVKVS
jgi:hypothetical protein